MILQKGEVRKVGIEVSNLRREPFIIETADYEVRKKDGTVVEAGTADIDEHKILFLFSAQLTGKFEALITYRIGAEIIIAKLYVEVV